MGVHPEAQELNGSWREMFATSNLFAFEEANTAAESGVLYLHSWRVDATRSLAPGAPFPTYTAESQRAIFLITHLLSAE